MDKAPYIHGLGGSSGGTSTSNIKKALDGLYEAKANTYDLLNPKEAYSQIKQDALGCDLIKYFTIKNSLQFLDIILTNC